MSENYFLNPYATLLDYIPIPTDDDKQRAQIYRAGFERLADLIAATRNKTLDLKGSRVKMVDVDDATDADVFESDAGPYVYSASSTADVQDPWILEASGMGHGRWVSGLWFVLLDMGADAKIKGSLLPGWRTTKLFEAHKATYINHQVITGSEWATVQDGSGNSLTATVNACTAGDRFIGSVGPFEMMIQPTPATDELIAGPQSVSLIVRVVQADANIAVLGPYVVSTIRVVAIPGTGVTGTVSYGEGRQHVTFPFDFVLPSDGGCDFIVESAGGSMSAPGSINNPATTNGHWGQSGQRQWLRGQVLRGGNV